MNKTILRGVSVATMVLGLSFAANALGQNLDTGSLAGGNAGINGDGGGVGGASARGNATYAYPFALPSARGGAQVALSLAYSSESGAGYAGRDWTLAESSIQRTPTTWNPGQPSTYDRFSLDGAPLVYLCTVGDCSDTIRTPAPHPEWATGWKYFRPQTESEAVHVYQSSDGKTWRVLRHSGVLDEYGKAKIGPFLGPEAIDWDTRWGTVRWHLSRRVDAHGTTPETAPNRVLFIRRNDEAATGRTYLSDIFYTPSSPGSFSSYAHHVRLTWETPSGYSVVTYAGVRSAPTERLKTVDVTSAPQGGGPRALVRRYNLSYLANELGFSSPTNQPTISPLLHTSFLASVSMQGRCEESTAEDVETKLPSTLSCPSLPPVRFEYTRRFAPEDGYARITGVNDSPEPEGSAINDPSRVAMLDINEDGLADIVTTHASDLTKHRAFLQHGAAGEFGGPNSAGPFSGSRQLNYACVDGANLPNGNMLLATQDGQSFPGFWGSVRKNTVLYRRFQTQPTLESWAIWKPAVPTGVCESAGSYKWELRGDAADINIPGTLHLVADVNADGLPDAWVYDPNTPGAAQNRLHRSWRNPVGGQPEHILAFDKPATNLSGAFVSDGMPLSQLADMNGDGFPDHVVAVNGAIVYQPGNGDGGFACDEAREGFPLSCVGGFVVPAGAPAPLPSIGTSSKVTIADVTADGLADVLEFHFAAADNYFQVWVNLDGRVFRQWTDAENNAVKFRMENPFNGDPALQARISFADVIGTGHPQVVAVTDNWQFHTDLMARPGYLWKVHNGLGGTTTFTYASLPYLQEKAFDDGYPWLGSQSARRAAQVVTKVEQSVDDANVAAYAPTKSIAYEYREPIWDPWNNSVLGFQRIVASSSAGNVTTTEYFSRLCNDDPQCATTSDDAPWRALTGLPVTTTLRFTNGTPVWTKVHRYHVELRGGLGGRHVWGALPYRTDTYLFDTGPYATHDDVPTVVQVADHPGAVAGDTPAIPPATESVPVTLPSGAGTAHLRVEREFMVGLGVTIYETNFGRDGIDTPITAEHAPDSHGPGWHPFTLRSDRETVSSIEGSRTLSYEYDGSDLLRISAIASGSPTLYRLEPNTEPLGASVAFSTIILSELEHDAYGNTTVAKGPQVPRAGGGTTRSCESMVYDATYNDTLVEKVTHIDGCGDAGLVSDYGYDRGLGAVTLTVAPTGASQLLEFDSFGRLSKVYASDGHSAPGPVVAAGIPDLVRTYSTPEDGPMQRVHTSTRDQLASYHEQWEFLDAYGMPLFTLSEADPGAGDGGDWVRTIAPTTAAGVASTQYRPLFVSDDPMLQTAPPSPAAHTVLTTTFLDGLGRPKEVRDGDGALLMEYWHHATSTTTYDGNAHSFWKHVYRDGFGRVQKTEEYLWSASDIVETKFKYLPTGEIGRIERDRQGPYTLPHDQYVRWFYYDSLGRLIVNGEPNTSEGFEEDPANAAGMRSHLYAYNDAGQLVGTSDARGCGANYFYDGLGRKIAEDDIPCTATQEPYSAPNFSTGDGIEIWNKYDAVEAGTPAGQQPLYADYLKGTLVASYDRGSHTRLSYDLRGHTEKVFRRVAKPADTAVLLDRYTDHWFEQAFEYNVANRLVTQDAGADVPELGGSATHYGYDARGLVTSIGSSHGPLVASVHHDILGRATSTVYGDLAATTATSTYAGARDHLTHYELKRTAPALWSNPETGYTVPTGAFTTATVLADQTYTYNDVDHPVTVTDARLVGEWPTHHSPTSVAYDYDAANRLTAAVYTRPGGHAQVDPFAHEASTGDTRAVPRQQFTERVKTEYMYHNGTGNVFYAYSDGDAMGERGVYFPEYDAVAKNRMVRDDYAGLMAHYDAAGNLVDMTLKKSAPCAGPCHQRFIYDWNETGEMIRARRWDFTDIPPTEDWPHEPTGTAARELRFKYSSGTRVLKSSKDDVGVERHTVEVLAGLRLDHAQYFSIDNDYERTASTESVYLAGGLGHVVYDPLLPSRDANYAHVFMTFGDSLGSASTTIDRATSEVVEDVAYLAYGQVDSDHRPARWSHHREDYRFTGKEEDVEIGLTYFGARYYSPFLRSWVSADPLTIHGAGSDLNPYAYVGGKVNVARDSNGLCFEVFSCAALTVAAYAAASAAVSATVACIYDIDACTRTFENIGHAFGSAWDAVGAPVAEWVGGAAETVGRTASFYDLRSGGQKAASALKSLSEVMESTAPAARGVTETINVARSPHATFTWQGGLAGLTNGQAMATAEAIQGVGFSPLSQALGGTGAPSELLAHAIEGMRINSNPADIAGIAAEHMTRTGVSVASTWATGGLGEAAEVAKEGQLITKGASGVLRHYTNGAGLQGILESGMIRANNGKVFATEFQAGSRAVQEKIFGNFTTHVGRGDYVIEFIPKQGVFFEAGKAGELFHRGTLRLGRHVEVIFAGPNPY